MALMTAGMATIATGVMVVYGLLGVDPGHLLTASVMSAPAALVIAKIMVPETQPSDTASGARMKADQTFTNSIDALCCGATEGVMMALNVLGMLIAFVAVVAMANYIGAYVLRKIFDIHTTTPLQILFGWVNSPFAWFLGIPWKDCFTAGQILGERVVLNEFVAYLSLVKVKATLDPRTVVVLSYALCGFANFGSIAVQIGGIGALAPERRADLAKLGIRAMVGGLLACYMTATIVGMLL
jgi:CNT family concentrative nucleoside transporter